MKIGFLNDVHLEFARYVFNDGDEGDVLCLNGDILVAKNCATVPHYHTFLQECSKRFSKVFYVLGNHEHYGSHIKVSRSKIEENLLYNFPNIKILEKEREVYNGIAFIGATMWTDYDNWNPLKVVQIQQSMNDYRHISSDYDRISPEELFVIHKKSVDYIFNEAKRYDKCVVMTHHAPSYQSCWEWKSDALNAAYATSLEEKILDTPSIKLWGHGHVHSFNHYMIGECNVVDNPNGYYEANVKIVMKEI